jgi:endonuclease VIII-like 1
MPEIAEIKIMSDHINNRCSGKIFNVVWKNPQHKSKTDLTEISKVLLEGAQISSFSRGKELEVRFESEHNKISLFFMMGMSGNFKFITDQEAPPKHTHLIFKGENFALCMYDLRRFARWRIDTNWSDKRGPCPLTEYHQFSSNILNLLDQKDFQKPMYEILMNQKFFNGIGNYLRAEILGRIDSDPQVPALKYIEKNPEVLRMCYEISKQAYEIGGGRLKDWFNNEEIEDSSNNFKNWMRYYSNSEVCSPIVDGTGRKFWLNKKWIS